MPRRRGDGARRGFGCPSLALTTDPAPEASAGRSADHPADVGRLSARRRGTGSEQFEVPPEVEAPIQFRSGSELAQLVGEEGAANLIGAGLELLRRAGLVSWEDCFGDDGLPEELERVVARKRLTMRDLVKAGFPAPEALRLSEGR
jgi:hypothetical protein